MTGGPDRHRRSLRLKDYDYAQAGAYFVTICTQDRACLFGAIVDGAMQLSDAGSTVEQCWSQIPEHFRDVVLDEFVVMPNHVHGILVINPAVPAVPAVPVVPVVPAVGATHASPLRNGPRPGSLGAIVGSFKSAVTRRINQTCHSLGATVWQRNYYEHIIRDEASLHGIREYIANNPLQWALDRENPTNETGRGIVGARHASPLPGASPTWEGV